MPLVIIMKCIIFRSVSNGIQYVGMCVSGWVNRVADEIIEIID